MEAITIVGIAVVAVGGYYSALDFLADLGVQLKKSPAERNRTRHSSSDIHAPQRRVKKMAGVNI